MSGPYGRTSGSDQRASRPMMEGVMHFRLADQLAALREEAQWAEGDRNSRTLAKDVDFRVVLTVMRDGAELDEQDGDARVSVQLIDGTASLRLPEEDDAVRLDAGMLAVVDNGRPWRLRADSDCAVLLTLAWPREKAGV
ncbi:MAG TPA: hypothetical protein VNW68_03695 [Candidatus Limnocylindria bacterium]|jgi:hypothetical protein|nr:hypothetical protein [Candidatus Limnocylindria bacterium]